MVKKANERDNTTYARSEKQIQQQTEEQLEQQPIAQLGEDLKQELSESIHNNWCSKNAHVDSEDNFCVDAKQNSTFWPVFNYAQHAQNIYQHPKHLINTTVTNYQHFDSTQEHCKQQIYNHQNYPSVKLQNAHLSSMHYNVTATPPIQTAGNSVSTIVPTEIPREDEERLERIFKQLDRDGDGKIDIHDLSAALHEFGLSSVYAEKFLQQSDRNQSGNVGFAEFMHYVREHEKNLCLQFSHLDKNCDGKVDLEELISAFKDLGLEIDVEEARKLLSRMDKDGSLNISYNEWRDFMLLAASTDIHDLIKFWRHSTYLDIGEDMNVPDDFTHKEMQTGLWWRHLVAGGFAGAVSRTCTAPLDRLKVFLQVQTHKMRISDVLRLMLNEGGPRSMWRGNGLNVMKIAPETALKFAAYEKLKNLLRGNDTQRQMSIGERFIAGAAAGGIAQTIIYPTEVLKTRLALARTGQYTGIIDAFKKILKNEGICSFYRGYVPNMIGIVPYAGIDLAVYETLKRRYIASHQGDEHPSFLVLLACGSTSSALGQLCSYPCSLVRTRLQAHAAETITGRKVKIPLASEVKKTNMTTMVRDIVHREGFAGLYRGITPNFLKVLPAVSISYVVYEYSSEVLGIKMS